MSSSKKIALVHDYLAEYGGAERVLEALCEAFPDAPIYVGFLDLYRLGIGADFFKNKKIKTTYLQKIPGIKKLYSPLRILAPRAFSKLDLSYYDVVISSTNSYFAKAVKVKKTAKHYCYCHTPARSLYGYNTKSSWQEKPLISFLGRISNHFLRIKDFNIAQKVDKFIANSHEVVLRIEKFYRRKDNVIIYPPVSMVDYANNLPTTKSKSADQDYYIYVNRLNFAKHPDLAVKACTQLGKKLYVIGQGEMLEELKSLANDNIVFCGSVSDQELASYYQNAKALLYPVEDEDFGIVPIEAAAFGVPVIAHFSGGPKETIIEGETGIFFTGNLGNQNQEEENLSNIKKAIHDLEKINWNRDKIIKHAQKFSKDRFIKEIKILVSI